MKVGRHVYVRTFMFLSCTESVNNLQVYYIQYSMHLRMYVQFKIRSVSGSQIYRNFRVRIRHCFSTRESASALSTEPSGK